MTDYTKFCTTDGEINAVCEASWWIRNASLYGIEEWATKAKAKLEELGAATPPETLALAAFSGVTPCEFIFLLRTPLGIDFS